MKESAQAALSYIRSRAKGLGIKDDLFSRTDLHIHVPAGQSPRTAPLQESPWPLLSLCIDRETGEEKRSHDRRGHS